MEPFSEFTAGVRGNDPAAVARVLDRHPELRARLDDALPGYGFGETALIVAVQHRNREMIDLLLDRGANVNQESHWWAGPFHAIDNAGDDPDLIAFLVARGATLDVHHLVRLDRIEDVKQALAADPSLICARGGDGQLPLHFAKTVAMADLLLDRGAEIDAIDVDHESTAAQWMIRDRHDVARHLVMDRGGRTDILLASALGDEASVTRILDADPAAIRTTVSEQYFPKKDARAGGTIYNWTLGRSKSAHEIAREFGHEDLVQRLLQRTPDDMKLSVACELGDEALFRQLLRDRPGIAATLIAEDRRKLADAARNNNATAVRLMLEAGWPPDARGQHNATALHWAGFHGNAAMVRSLLAHGAPVDIKGDEYDGTPLHWTIYGSEHGWQRDKGDYPATVDVLLAGGASLPRLDQLRSGAPEVIDVLRRHGAR